MAPTFNVLLIVGLMLGRGALCLPQQTQADFVDKPTLTAQQTSGHPGLLLSMLTCEFIEHLTQLSSSSIDSQPQRNRPLSLQD